MRDSWRDRIVELAFERGLLILGCGETSIRLAPPLVVSREEAIVALDILEACVVQAQGERNLLPTTELPAAENAGS